MADISTELAAIMAAVFGKDVRKSIHDAIFKINVASESQLDIGTAITSASSSSEGYMEDSLYINSSTWQMWRCTGTDSWELVGSIKGVDGRAISSITGPITSGNVDTYTINYSDGSTPTTFTVTNGIDGKDGSQWYKGTALTSTGSGLTGFPGKLHDFYINTDTGYVYTCTNTGDATTARWDWIMVLSGGGGAIAVVDQLNSDSGTDALSARQGKVLNTNKIDKPSSPSQGQLLGFDGTDWEAVNPPEGHPMVPDPTSTAPVTADAQEAAIVQAVNSAMTDVNKGWADDEVPSLNSMGHWSNTMTKTYTIQGIAGNTTPVGTTGIGTWYDGDPADLDPITDEADWITIPALIGIGSDSKIDIHLVYDPLTSTTPVVLGGYEIDDVTGKMCIKFAYEIDEADTHTVLIGIELINKRTEIIPISF